MSFKCQEDKNKVIANGSLATFICDYEEPTSHVHLRGYKIDHNPPTYSTPAMTRIPDKIIIANWSIKALTRKNDAFKNILFKTRGCITNFSKSTIFKNVQTIDYNDEIEGISEINKYKQHQAVQIYEAFETDAIIVKFNNWPAIMYKYGLQSLQAFQKNGQWTWIMTDNANANPLFIIQASKRSHLRSRIRTHQLPITRRRRFVSRQGTQKIQLRKNIQLEIHQYLLKT